MIRFIDNGDETVTDTETGLIWVKSPFDVKRTWQKALDYVACLNIGGYLDYTDWRLPDVNELKSLINAEQSNSAAWLNTQGFLNVQSNYYWSSTSSAAYPKGAGVVSMWSGIVDYDNKSYHSYVWPVRSGQKAGLMYILTQGSALLAESETLEEIKAIRDSYPPMVKAWLTIGENQKIRPAEMEGEDGTV